MKIVCETMSSQKFLFMNYILYLLENKINHKKYIGQTLQGIDIRIKQHIKDAELGSNYIIHRALRKYGIDNFDVRVLLVNIPDKDIDYYEMLWIKKFNTYYKNGFGYNQTYGGRGTNGYAFTTSIKRKMSINHNYSIYTSERNKKISDKLKGKHFTDKHKEKLSNSMKNKYGELNNFYGRHHTDVSKRKIAIANGVKVECFDLNNNFICSFDVINDAVRWLISLGKTKNTKASTRIIGVCKGKPYSNTAYGYIWRYAEKV